ncbi:MAG TPA: RNA-binding protein [Candidatus Hydrogenedentes bacterium]|nr:RNA-binding protein [Candidatus Hydrogenedentota bacterium]
MNIYVGNLSYTTTDESLREVFEAFGEVSSARVVTDRETGRSRGFGFVEMPSSDEGHAGIAALNGQDLDGRSITVNEARPKEDSRGPRGGEFRDRGGRSEYRSRRY